MADTDGWSPHNWFAVGCLFRRCVGCDCVTPKKLPPSTKVYGWTVLFPQRFRRMRRITL